MLLVGCLGCLLGVSVVCSIYIYIAGRLRRACTAYVCI